MRVKKSSLGFLVYLARVITGGWIGLVLAYIFRMIFNYGEFLFFFVIVLATAAVVRISRSWGLFAVVILNLFFILLCLLSRMYIMVASGT